MLLNSLSILLNKLSIKKQIIGIRHAEKMHEILMSSEEANKSLDLGGFYKIPLDNRDLNYNLYYEKGKKITKIKDEYSSINTDILSVQDLVKLFKKDAVLQKLKNEVQ